MGDPAPTTGKAPLAIEGLEGIFDVEEELGTDSEQPGTSNGTDSKQQESPGTAYGTVSWLSVEQAAQRLNISANAVIKRLGKGKLAGRKVPGQFGEKWLVDPSGLPTEIHIEVTGCDQSTAPEQPSTSSDTASSQQESPGTANGIASESLKLLGQVIQTQNEQLQAQTALIKHLTGELQDRDKKIKLLTDSQHQPRGGWSRFWSWFLGR